MTTQPDIIWNDQCLGMRIGEQVCTYLKKHDAEYQRLQKKILELTEKYPVIETFMESNQSISLTEEEHKAVHRYFQLESEKEMIEEEYHFYMGQAQMISYGAMLGKIKKAILGKDDGDTQKLLELLLDTPFLRRTPRNRRRASLSVMTERHFIIMKVTRFWTFGVRNSGTLPSSGTSRPENG